MKRFEVGGRYATNSACDHTCWWQFSVTRRTEKCVWLTCHNRGEFKNRRFLIKEWNGAEYVLPFGRHSMCPVLRASDSAGR